MKLSSNELSSFIKGYEGIYSITTFGRVYSHRSNIFMKLIEDSYGYLCVNLKVNGKAKMHKVHRLVGIAFIDNVNIKPTINHIDCNKKNNHVTNLEWATVRENTIHAIENNLIDLNSLILLNEKVKKFSQQEVYYIRENFGKNHNYNTLAKKFNVSRGVIYQIVKRKTYKEECTR